MMNLPPKILIVDIDGCLTSVDTGTYFSIDPNKYGPSKIIVNKIKQFCKDNDAKIIISSNWRKFDSNGIWKNAIGSFKNPLNNVIEQLGEYYHSTLPATRHVTKSQELVGWLNNTHYNGSFAIFDDDANEGYQTTIEHEILKKFILVDSYYGITMDNLEMAKTILTH